MRRQNIDCYHVKDHLTVIPARPREDPSVNKTSKEELTASQGEW